MLVDFILSAVLIVLLAELFVSASEFKKIHNKLLICTSKITDIYEKIEELRKAVDVPYSSSELKEYFSIQNRSPYPIFKEAFNSSYNRPNIGEIGRLLMDHLKLTTKWVPGETGRNIVVPEEATSESDPTP